MRIAIVGAGISGLVCAHLLHEQHDLTVFEANDYAGGHTHTVRVDTADETHHVDTGLHRPQRPQLPALRAAARERRAWPRSPRPMSFSVSDGRGGLEYNGASANGLFANRANLVQPLLPPDGARPPALQPRGARAGGPERQRDRASAQFLDEGGYSRVFVDRLLVPQASAVWSADPASMWEFPASLLAEFFANHGMFGFTRPPALARGHAAARRATWSA